GAATPGAAKRTAPAADKARLEQKIAGGFAGGPVVRNRAFFFASLEHLLRDTDYIVTSPVFQVFRPGQDVRLPQSTRNPNLLGRAGLHLAPANHLVVRYRFDDGTSTN